MARPRSTDRPRTRWTDTNGRLLDEFSTSSHRELLQAFSQAGLSPKALSPNGCETPVMSPEWDITTQGTGCISDLLYTLSRHGRGLNGAGDVHRDNVLDILAVMDRFLAIGSYLQLGEQYRSLVARLAHGAIEWRRMVFYVPNGIRLPDAEMEAAYSADNGSAEAAAAYDTEMRAWGMPETLRGEDHNGHGHGKSALGWACLPEDLEPW